MWSQTNRSSCYIFNRFAPSPGLIAEIETLAPRGGFDGEVVNGELRALRFDVSATDLELDPDASAEDVARAFLETWGPDLLRIDDPIMNLGLHSIRPADENHWHGYFRQHVHGIPIYGAELSLTLFIPDGNPTTVRRLVGRYVPDFHEEQLATNLASVALDAEGAIRAFLAAQDLDQSAYAVGFDGAAGTWIRP